MEILQKQPPHVRVSLLTLFKHGLARIQISIWNLIIKLLTESKLLRRTIRFVSRFSQDGKMLRNSALILVLFFLVFGLCSFSSSLLNNTGLSSILSAAKPTLQSAQNNPEPNNNLVIIRVDDLQSATPSLVSVWGLFVNKAVFPAIIFKPLYFASGQDSKLNRQFVLTANKKLSSEFLKSLQKYNFSWSNTAIVDDQSFIQLINVLTISDQSISSKPSSNSLAQILSEPNNNKKEIHLFQQVCSSLENLKTGSPLENAWDNFLTIPIITDIPKETLFNNWKKTIISQTETIQCQVMEK
jgi:hypothetical protein